VLLGSKSAGSARKTRPEPLSDKNPHQGQGIEPLQRAAITISVCRPVVEQPAVR